MVWSVAAFCVGAALAAAFSAIAFTRTRSRLDAVLLESVRRLAEGDLLTAITVPGSGSRRELAALLQDLAARLSLTLTQVEVAKARGATVQRFTSWPFKYSVTRSTETHGAA